MAVFAVFGLVALGATGCGMLGVKKSEDKAATVSPDDLGLSVSKLNAKIESLENKITQLNEKLDKQKASEGTVSVKPKAVAVTSHPSEARGTPVQPIETSQDAEGGFVNDPPVQAYRRAIILFQADKYSEAILAFSAFLEAFPDHAMAGTAQYHLGQCYLRQKEYKLALQEYQRVLTSYDRSASIADALRDTSQAEEALKRTQDAARHRQQLVSLFPQSPAAAAMEVATAPAAPQIEPVPAAPPTKERTSSPHLDEPPPPTAPLPGKAE